MADFNQQVSDMLKPTKEDARAMSDMRSSVALQGLEPAKSSKPTKSNTPTVEDMNMAIQDISDMAQKTMIQFVALGDFAKAVRDHTDILNADHIEIGFPKSQLTVEIKSLFKTWGFEEAPYGYKYYFTPPIKWDTHVPVEIHVFQRKYKFFTNLDLGWYMVDDFYLPNPFDTYWKARYLIK